MSSSAICGIETWYGRKFRIRMDGWNRVRGIGRVYQFPQYPPQNFSKHCHPLGGCCALLLLSVCLLLGLSSLCQQAIVQIHSIRCEISLSIWNEENFAKLEPWLDLLTRVIWRQWPPVQRGLDEIFSNHQWLSICKAEQCLQWCSQSLSLHSR